MKMLAGRTLAVRRRLGSLLRVVAYVLAFVVPPLAVGVAGIAAVALPGNPVAAPEGFDASRLAPPPYDPSRPTVAIVMGNHDTEITDFLAPYEIFSASEAFNVYAVAPKRQLSPLSSRLDVMPHFSFAEFETFLGKAPDVIVVPYIPEARQGRSEAHAVVDWIRANAGENTVVVSICAGAGMLAQTGLLDGRPATSHWQWIGGFEKQFPAVRWTRNARYVDSGNTITSAGITAGMDVSFYTVKRLAGEEVARETARKLGYPHTKYIDSNEYQQPEWALSDTLMLFSLGYRWERPTMGLYLYDGVGELDLSSVLDSYPASGVARIVTFGQAREAVRSRNGLTFIPRLDFQRAGGLDGIIVPGSDLPPAAEQALMQWAQARPGVEIATLQAFAGSAAAEARYPFDVALTGVAQRGGRPVAVAAAKALEYPIGHLTLDGHGSGVGLLLRPLAIGLLAIGAAAWIERKRRARRQTGDTRRAPMTGSLPV